MGCLQFSLANLWSYDLVTHLTSEQTLHFSITAPILFVTTIIINFILNLFTKILFL